MAHELCELVTRLKSPESTQVDLGLAGADFLNTVQQSCPELWQFLESFVTRSVAAMARKYTTTRQNNWNAASMSQHATLVVSFITSLFILFLFFLTSKVFIRCRRL